LLRLGRVAESYLLNAGPKPFMQNISRSLVNWCRRLAIIAFAAIPVATMASDIGKPAPTFELPGLERAIRLSDFQGKFVYIDFWASWCGPCRQSFPWMNEMQSKYGNQGFQIIGINVDTGKSEATEFLAANKANFLIAFDPKGTMPSAYAIKGMPSSVLVGPDGKIVFRHVGFNKIDTAELENKIKSVLARK
jgi:thiol-disulfide isomerase/thioredoxin